MSITRASLPLLDSQVRRLERRERRHPLLRQHLYLHPRRRQRLHLHLRLLRRRRRDRRPLLPARHRQLDRLRLLRQGAHGQEAHRPRRTQRMEAGQQRQAG